MIQAPQSTIGGPRECQHSSSETIKNVPRRRRTLLESGDVPKLASAQHVVCDTHVRRVVCKRISRSGRFDDVCRRHESTLISLHLLAKRDECVEAGAPGVGARRQENINIRDMRHELEAVCIIQLAIQVQRRRMEWTSAWKVVSQRRSAVDKVAAVSSHVLRFEV